MRTMSLKMAQSVCFRTWAAALVSAALLGLSWVAAQEATVKGRVIPGAGTGASDWRVLAVPRLSAEIPRDAAGVPAGLTPEADGSFVLGLPGTGTVFLCPYIGGRLAADDVVPLRVTAGGEPPPEVALTPKAPRERVAFVLQSEDGAPVGRRVKVHLYNLYGEVDGSDGGTWTDGAGTVSYERLPSARYDLWVENPAPDAAPGADDLPAAVFRGLDVEPGDGPQTIELSVPRSGAVRGVLVGADGNAPAAEHVVAVQSGTVPADDSGPDGWPAAYARGALACYAQAGVAEDGAFLLPGLTPGEHSLDVRRPGERDAWCTIQGVEVTAGQVADLGTVRLAQDGWEYMFDRRTLDGWVESNFYGQKEVRIENDTVILSMGTDMTGITWDRAIPRVDYEVSLQAMRVAGDDFFCGLTFPVEDSYCSLILGGWGGSVVGLSSLDGADASENDTSDWIQFKGRRWYGVRVRVTADNIAAWLDQDNIVDVATEDREISTRIEVERSKPFGIATWCTTGAIRDIRIRRLDAQAP